jgi:hypothetical protein
MTDFPAKIERNRFARRRALPNTPEPLTQLPPAAGILPSNRNLE